MILVNREFERKRPTRDAKSIYIFCEGKKREYQYFKFFSEKDSRINIQVYPLKSTENNSPLGLFQIAEKSFYPSKENNFSPLYNFIKGDEVWIVVDTDPDKLNSRIDQLKIIREDCTHKQGWFVVESNPCFEVWLYYHLNTKLPEQFLPNCSHWKALVNAGIVGGFDARRHPIYIEDAINNSNLILNQFNNELRMGTTQVHLLGNSIVNVLGEKIRKIRRSLH